MAIFLENPNDKSLEQLIVSCRDLVENADFPTVQAWRNQGGKVLGHFQVYFPEEIAHAAGMLPVKVRGAPIDARNAESRFGSYLCSIIKTSLELVLSGHLELDMFVTHPICDAARNLSGIWDRNFSYPARILYLPQNATADGAGEYLMSEYRELVKEVEDVTGNKVTDRDLRNSIKVFNKNRRLIRDLYQIKRTEPWKVSVDEAYVLVKAGAMIPREEHNEILEAALSGITDREAKEQDKVRIVFEGGFCEQPPLDLIQIISNFCYVVDDDLMIGLRWIKEDVPVEQNGKPLQKLADAYLNKSTYSPVQHDCRKPKDEMLMNRINRSGAEAVVLGSAKMCEPGLDEQVTYTEKLEEEEIPYFISEFEETMTNFDHLQLQLETFVEGLQFFGEPVKQ